MVEFHAWIGHDEIANIIFNETHCVFLTTKLFFKKQIPDEKVEEELLWDAFKMTLIDDLTVEPLMFDFTTSSSIL